MLQVHAGDVVADPYPHVVSETMIEPGLFARLKADFPDSSIFEKVSAETASVGSRAGKGTGFDVYRGDAAYDALIARSEAWREFDAWINSPQFVAKYQELFGSFADAMDIKADIGESVYERDYVEPREVLTEDEGFGERMFRLANQAVGGLRGRKPVQLFSRLDITRSLGGYAKPPHCDRPNRLCSLIVYFSDAEESGLQGGDLLVFKAKKEGPIRTASRHPAPDDVEVVAQLRPKANMGVFFPCCNTSYHGVTAVTSQGIPRDFLYINISGKSAGLW